MKLLLLVFLGSGIGGTLRYLFGVWAQRAFGATFPCGTLGVNLIGSFLIMVIMHLGLNKGVISDDVRILLSTGVMGGFTTYSAFNYETMRFFQERAYAMGLLNIAATVFGCLLAATAAMAIVKWLM